jgi:hypothetical protein
VLSQDGENIFFISTQPGYNHLYGEILDWTLANWGPRYASVVAEVNEGQSEARSIILYGTAMGLEARRAGSTERPDLHQHAHFVCLAVVDKWNCAIGAWLPVYE